MSTAWDTYHRRAAALRDVVTRLDDSDGTGPLWTDDVAGIYEGPDDVLLALQDLWARRLHARVDQVLEIQGGGDRDSVAGAWRAVAAGLPGVRRVLDAHADNPVLARARRNEHRLLAVAAGLATLDDPVAHSAEVGAELVEGLRDAVPTPRRGLRARAAAALHLPISA